MEELTIALSLYLSVDITLDPTTAHPRLTVSADGKRVHCGDRHQVVPDNLKRFDRVVCVLANQGFNSGRHYWEVGNMETSSFSLNSVSMYKQSSPSDGDMET